MAAFRHQAPRHACRYVSPRLRHRWSVRLVDRSAHSSLVSFSSFPFSRFPMDRHERRREYFYTLPSYSISVSRSVHDGGKALLQPSLPARVFFTFFPSFTHFYRSPADIHGLFSPSSLCRLVLNSRLPSRTPEDSGSLEGSVSSLPPPTPARIGSLPNADLLLSSFFAYTVCRIHPRQPPTTDSRDQGPPLEP
jgi:hypothetical protein